jgi:hypothetical protein
MALTVPVVACVTAQTWRVTCSIYIPVPIRRDRYLLMSTGPLVGVRRGGGTRQARNQNGLAKRQDIITLVQVKYVFLCRNCINSVRSEEWCLLGCYAVWLL